MSSALPPSSSSLNRRNRSSSHSQLPPQAGHRSDHHGRIGSMGDIPSSSSHQPISRTDEFYSATNSPFSPIPNTTTTTRQIDIEASNPPPPPPPVPLTVWGQLWRILCDSLREFYYSLLPRSEAFRTDFAPRFTNFYSKSTKENDNLWEFYKWVLAIGMYGTFLCIIAGILYGVFGEAKSSPPTHLHSFILNSPAANTASLCLGGVVFTIVYVVSVCSFWDDLFLYKIREKYIAFVSLDLVVEFRIVKALLLTLYSFYNLEKKWGDWTIVIFVLLPFFFTLSSISMLKLFEPEFLNATGLIRDFSVILVGPSYTFLHQCYKHHNSSHSQHHHDYSLLKGLLFLIPIIFGYITNTFIPYIYRPHNPEMRYAPDDEIAIRYDRPDTYDRR